MKTYRFWIALVIYIISFTFNVVHMNLDVDHNTAKYIHDSSNLSLGYEISFVLLCIASIGWNFEQKRRLIIAS